MTYLDRLSLPHKILHAILVAVVVTVGLTVGIFLWSDVRIIRLQAVESALMQARLAAQYSVTPLAFRDVEGARSILTKFHSVAAVRAVAVLDSEENLFASSVEILDSGYREILDPQTHRSEFTDRGLVVTAPVRYDNRLYGYVYLLVSTSPMTQTIISHALWIALIVVLVVGLSVVLALRLGRPIARPVLELAKVTERMTGSTDFSVRLHSPRSDEIGLLYRNFDGLLQRIVEKQRQRDEAEQALRNSEARTRAMIDGMPDLLFMFDRDGVFTDIAGNKQSLMMPSEQFLGKRMVDVMPAIVYEPAMKSLEAAFATGRIQLFEYRLPVAGETRHFEARMIPLSAREALAVIRDTTDRRKTEAQLVQAQKMETVGALASGLAHDFNNVLSGIMATTSLMKVTLEKEGSVQAADLADSIDIIGSATRRAAEMVRQLLSLSRRQEVSLAPVDLNDTVRNVHTICKNSFDKAIVLDFRVAPGPAVIMADPTQMEQVLLNLCVNAEHAMTFMRPKEDKPGGLLTVEPVRIEAGPEFIPAHPKAVTGKSYWTVRVSDTGVGIERGMLHRIFDPFYTTKDKLHGTGLGLAMVYNIVELHGGFIDVYSEPGAGAAFSVYLPVAEPAGGEAAVEEEAFPAAATPANVLIIDDEELVRQSAQKILQVCGYNVVCAEDGITGVELYRNNPADFDIVLLDLSMPIISGKETFLRLKQINPDVKVVMSSGFRFDERVDESLAAGVLGLVQKPYTVNVLLEEIGSALALSR